MSADWRALSLRQPWAYLVVTGSKLVENRTRNTHFRGWFMVHAPAGMTRQEYVDCQRFIARAARETGHLPELPYPFDLHRSGMVGLGRLDGVREPQEHDDGWHMADQFGYDLGAVRETPFIGCKGNRGFWRVPESVVRRLQDAGVVLPKPGGWGA